ncbi:MAG TPA: hypothetical protein VD793_00375 [Gemmatimonadales bacterium]|nr:hypothetical protein [Gemmatimonadales bacterium]
MGLAVAWIGYVLWRHADPSVRGIYVWFYLVMGYAAVKIFGQSVAQVFGARVRVDAGERRNLAAAVLSAALTLATGLIFGGSLWGEADPTGEGEGGWWIPVTFFLLGWGVLVGAFKLFLAREAGDLKPLIRQERDLADARAAGVFLLSCSVVLTDAVAGDFWGWSHGLLTFGVLAGMLLVREMFARRSGGDQPQDQSEGRRVLESGVYVLLSGGAWLLNRMLDAALGPG